MIKAAQKQAERKEAERRAIAEQERKNLRILQEQIDNRKDLEREAREEYLKEKAVVDR